MSFNKGTNYEFNLATDAASQRNVDTGTTAKVRRVLCWVCEVCTYLNQMIYPKCKICRTARNSHGGADEEGPPKPKQSKLPHFFSASAPPTTMPPLYASALASASPSVPDAAPSFTVSRSSTSSSKLSVLSLQDELLDHIFSYLDNKARFSCLSISHAAATLLQSRPKAWGAVLTVDRHYGAKTWAWLCKLGFREIVIEKNYATKEVLMGLAGCLKLQRLNVKHAVHVTDEVIAALAKRCPLRALSLNKGDITDNALALLSDCVLEVLDLVDCLALTDEGLFHLKHHSRLHVLQLPWNKNISSKGLAHLQKLPLQVLNVSMCPEVTDQGLAELANCPLERLSVNGCNISDAGLANLQKQQSLRWLAVEGCTKITDAGLASLRGLERLELLHLAHCTRLTDAGLANIAHLPLRILHISRNPLLSDDCLARLSPTIQNLEVNWSPWLTNKGLQHLGERLPNLRVLDVSGCKQLTDAGLGFIAALPLRSLSKRECPLITKRRW